MLPCRLAVILISSFALGLAACRASASSSPTQSSSSTAASKSAKQEALLPAPSGPLDLTLAEGTKLTLEELLGRLSKLTGVTFSIEGGASELLKNDVVALSQNKRVPAAEVYPWVESILQQNGYVLAVLHEGDVPLLGVYANRGPRSSQPNPIGVPVEQIDSCREHPALYVTTVVHLPNTDVRTLANSLRGMANDAVGNSSIMPVGNTNNVILTGSGRNVSDLVAILLTVDARAATDASGAAKPAQAAAPAKQ
jgi:type II secretory pathway component GspD/PulD (secretin)